ncbi:MAG TPA: hypothetical protein VML75_23530 [Kofleriaceae bacterium]|nr:hypothetical protein [Kofleriaceae bacterium]
MKRIMLATITCLAAAGVGTDSVRAEPEAEPATSWINGTLSYSNLRRSDSASGVRAAVGYDRMVADAISMGGRVGIARHADGFGSSTLPYVGVRAAWWSAIGTESLLRVGGGAELWINSSSETGIHGEPVFLHLLAEIGPRFRRGEWTIEVPVELGVMPYFDPPVYTLQIGLQLGRAL